jgi:hypothetical protein
VLKRNESNNLYARNIYYFDWPLGGKKNYSYFAYFPEMAQDNRAGLEIATESELILKYIPEWLW